MEKQWNLGKITGYGIKSRYYQHMDQDAYFDVLWGINYDIEVECI